MEKNSKLKLKKIGINTYKEAVIYMRHDCHVCKAEGFEVHARVLVSLNGNHILATLNTIENGFLEHGEASLSVYAWNMLQAQENDLISLSHPSPLNSLSHVRAKIFNKVLNEQQINEIVSDVSKGYYSDIHIATFLTACAGGRLSHHEITMLTNSMVEAGDRLTWPNQMVVDKHCIGGLPGNRTTPIIVSIVSAFGMLMPKTSSRAITSPAGTADVMEVLAPVDLSLKQMQRVVEIESGCIVWGGSVSLSPADDILIRVERAIDLDSEGQLVASVLSKKIAAGSTDIVIDIPVGSTAKVRNQQDALHLKEIFEYVAKEMGLNLVVLTSDGLEPVGNGIGPSLEAEDVISVLKNDSGAPQDLRERALAISAKILEFSPKCAPGEGYRTANDILNSGKAWAKFQSICETQGGMRDIPRAKYSYNVTAKHSGVVSLFDNRNLARVAKLAGAPTDKTAGVLLNVHLGDEVNREELLFTLYADSKGELEYAQKSLEQMPNLIGIKESV